MLICGWRGSSGRGARYGRGSRQTGQLRAILEGARAVPRRRATGISSPKAKTTGEWVARRRGEWGMRGAAGEAAPRSEGEQQRREGGREVLRRRRCARRRATTPRTSRRRRKGSWRSSSSMYQRDMSSCASSVVEPSGACWPRASTDPDPRGASAREPRATARRRQTGAASLRHTTRMPSPTHVHAIG